MTSKHFWYEEETRPWNETQQQQAELLPALVARLRADSGLYEDLDGGAMATADPLAALNELPFTQKNDLRSGQAQGASDDVLGRQQAVPRDRLEQVISSTGTTGAPVYFGLTRADRRAWADALGAFYSTAGVAPGSIAALSTGMPIVAGGVPYADGIREAGGALVWFGGQTTSRMVTTLDRLRVDTLVATASFTTFFAARVEEELGRPASELPVQTLIAGGEPGMGLPDVRAEVLGRWGATRLSEVMGLGDVLSGIWAECEAGAGMHFTALRDVLVELIDPESGERLPWEEGATGEAVYTTLRREATPVLRFRSRDHIEVQGMACVCGRRTPRIRCIGRTDDMLIYKAMNVFPSSIREVALSVAGETIDPMMRIRKADAKQVRFEEPIPLEVQLRSDHVEARDETQHRIESAVRERLRVRVAVEFLEPGTLSITGDKHAMVYAPQEPSSGRS